MHAILSTPIFMISLQLLHHLFISWTGGMRSEASSRSRQGSNLKEATASHNVLDG